MGGRGVPPFSAKKKSVENWPKNSAFWGKKCSFLQKILILVRGGGAGGYPPFPLTFWPAAFRYGRKFSVTGVLEHFPNLSALFFNFLSFGPEKAFETALVKFSEGYLWVWPHTW